MAGNMHSLVALVMSSIFDPEIPLQVRRVNSVFKKCSAMLKLLPGVELLLGDAHWHEFLIMRRLFPSHFVVPEGRPTHESLLVTISLRRQPVWSLIVYFISSCFTIV